MQALVTGGGGFLGSALSARLLADGHSVRVFARGDYPKLREAGAETVRGDLRDAEAIGAAAAHVDVVFHVAAKAGYYGDPAEFEAINVQGTRNVLSACRGQGVKRLVFTSTPSVVAHGGPLEGGNESQPYPERHVAHYPRTKAAAEAMVMEADGGESGLRTVSIRPRGIWGPGDTQLFPRLVQWTREGRLARLGKGDPLQDFAYIDNVVEAHVLAAERLETAPEVVGGKTYFISDGAPVGCWTMVDKVLQAAGLAGPKKVVPLGLARFLGVVVETLWALFRVESEPRLNRYKVAALTQPCHFDISAARRDLGYEPTVGLEEGLVALRVWVQTGGLDEVLKENS
jgi:2-alkyl-3-oxoalkanoate reductase